MPLFEQQVNSNFDFTCSVAYLGCVRQSGLRNCIAGLAVDERDFRCPAHLDAMPAVNLNCLQAANSTGKVVLFPTGLLIVLCVLGEAAQAHCNKGTQAAA